MTNYNMLDDLATLTTIHRSSFDKLVDRSQCVICHDVEEAELCGENTVNINIGIGTLTIRVEEDTIKYRFTPSQSLNANIKNTIVTGKSPLTAQAETLLKDRICNAYKDLF